jgi:ribosomal protein S27E
MFYAADGDEESRCPDCESSQRTCDFCDAQGAETCINCGQWVCKTCWPRHADMGGVRECKGGAKRSKKRRPPKPADTVHARLKAAIEIKTTVTFWVSTSTFTPCLCSKVFGDGRALLQLWALNSRPRFYIIRIDSTWEVDDYDAPGDAPDLHDHLDDIYAALESDFGAARWADDEDVQDEGPERVDEMREWPAFNDDAGTSWARFDWPTIRGIALVSHPYANWMNMLAARASPERAAQREAKRRRARLRKRRGW